MLFSLQNSIISFASLNPNLFRFSQIVINPVSQQCICSFQCKLTVHPRQKQSPPYFVEKLSPAKVDMRGENVSLFVKATGKPMPNLTWLKVRFEMHAYHYLLLYFPTCIFNYFSILFYKRLIKWHVVLKVATAKLQNLVTLQHNLVW